MSKFEYQKKIYHRFMESEALDDMIMTSLKEEGKDGWELVTLFKEELFNFHSNIFEDKYVAIFKRELKERS